MGTIITKNSATSGSVPASLIQGELAINVTDGKLFYGSGSGNDVKEFGVTASYALNALTASYAISASYEINYETSSSYADYAVSASHALTASFITASGVYGPYGSNSVISASFALTASSALNASDILVRVLNQSGNPISKGIVVRITGSNNASDIPRIVTASYENDNNSANTLGIANETIANGAEGFVMTEGVLKGINTSAFVSGQLIYLGPTGSIIGTAPVAPLHSVRLGEVIREQLNNGSIYVRIDNGYELGELHDVRDTTTTSSYGDLLVKSGSIWINSKQLTGSYGLTGSLTATSFTGSLQGTSSWANNATTASYALQALSASFASTVPASGVIGLNLSQIATASFTASVSPTQFTVTSASITEFTITGTGTTIGNATTDTHRVTGSLTVTGSTTITGPLTATQIGAGATPSGSVPLDVRAQGALSTDLALRVRNSANTANLMDIRGNGNVGIGTTSDAGFRLDVSGSTRIGGTQTRAEFDIVNGEYKFRGENGNKGIDLGYYATNSGGFISSPFNGINILSTMWIENGTEARFITRNANFNWNLFNSTWNIRDYITGAQRLSINQAGNLLIGTGSINANYTLDVSGSGNFRNNLTVTGSTTITGPLTATQIGAGAAPSGSIPLDVRAQGALSTDIAFRVRNSANSSDITSIQGDGVLNNIGNINVGINTGGAPRDISISGYQNNRLIFNSGYNTYGTNLISVTRRNSIGSFADNTMLFQHTAFSDGNNVPYRMHFVNPSLYYGSVAAYNYNAGFMWFKDSATVANLQMKLSPDNALSIYTSSASPIESVITGSGFQIWASGSAGNAYPHIRTQNGTLLWLGSESRLFNVTASRTIISSSQSTASGSSLTVYGSGSAQPVFTVQGSQGELFSVTDSLSGSLFSVNDISGLPILEVFSDNTTLIGNYLDPMLITTAKVTQTNSGSFVVYSLPTASYDTAFFEYSIKSGSNARAGTIMAIQSGTSVNFTETTTTDFGNTTPVSFTVVVTGSNMALTGSSTTGSWTIKTIIRSI